MVKIFILLITVFASLMISFLYLGIFLSVKTIITRFVAKVSAENSLIVAHTEIASSNESQDKLR